MINLGKYWIMRTSNEIRILVVEDQPEKMDAIISQITTEFSKKDEVGVYFERADCFSKAQSHLERTHFDVVVLDLKIPVVPISAGGEPRIETSKDLYEYIRRSAPSKPFFILGLTSTPEKEVSDHFIEGANFTIERFDAGSKWLTQLIERIEFVLGAKSGLANHLNNNFGIDVLIVTARKRNEFDPIIDQIAWHGNFSRKRPEVKGMHNSFGRISLDENKDLSVGIVCLDEMGLSHSSAVCTNLIHEFRPKYMAMLGMCCGLQKMPDPKKETASEKIKLGDIIVASNTSCWDEGRYEDEDPELKSSPFFNNRAVNKAPQPDFWRTVDRFLDQHSSEIQKDIETFYKASDPSKLRKELKKPTKFMTDAKIHRGAIVSGPCVIDSTEFISSIEHRFPRAIGLEMEAHSVYSASESCFGLRPNILVIKGVADFGDGTKAKALQKVASAASYKTYLKLLSGMFDQDREKEESQAVAQ